MSSEIINPHIQMYNMWNNSVGKSVQKNSGQVLYSLLRYALNLLKDDLRIIVAQGEGASPELFVCPPRLRGEGCCILVSRLVDVLRDNIQSTEDEDADVKRFYHFRRFERKLVTNLRVLWNLKTLDGTFPVHVDAALSVDYRKLWNDTELYNDMQRSLDQLQVK